jgi:hypothetical protein
MHMKYECAQYMDWSAVMCSKIPIKNSKLTYILKASA